MPNLQLSYLYRDFGNYKNFGSVVFANPTNELLEDIEHRVKKYLIDGCWFYPEEWKLPDLKFDPTNPSDPTWHEFESLEYTGLHANSALSLQEFMLSIEKSARPIV